MDRKESLSRGQTGRQVATFAETFPKTLSLVEHRTRCGKRNCRCFRGDLHTSYRLVWRENGKQRHRYVPFCAVSEVRSIVDRRRMQAKSRRMELAEALAWIRNTGRWARELGLSA